MAKVAAGPMGSRGKTGGFTGIAYAANVRSVRSSHTVWIGSSNSTLATARAYDYLSNRDDVHIISMSLGRILTSSMLARAIKKCTSRGKLVFTAAGTLLNNRWVTNALLTAVKRNRASTLFPARMSETIACTGILKNTQDWCDSCHGEADFVTEFRTDDVNQSSSYSTATTAGIAGLIWGENPNKSADQVLQEMKNISDNKNRKIGWRGHGRLHLDRYKKNDLNPL
jgi:hypothetical protein